ncbi:MAG: adenine deaminase C-terminal domain-containing protein [Bacteroidota bacterium]
MQARPLKDGKETKIRFLPIAGIMTAKDGWEAGKLYEAIDTIAKALGSILRAPFMALSFMVFPVIPDLKLPDKGLFSRKDF